MAAPDEHDPPWKPLRAFDDGERVYIQFHAGIVQGELPPLFVIGAQGDGQPDAFIRVARPSTPRPATARLLCGPQLTNLQWAEAPRKHPKLLLYIGFSRRARHQNSLTADIFYCAPGFTHFRWFRKRKDLRLSPAHCTHAGEPSASSSRAGLASRSRSRPFQQMRVRSASASSESPPSAAHSRGRAAKRRCRIVPWNG